MMDMTSTHESPTATSTEEPGPYPASTLSLRLDVDGIGVSWTLRGTDESMSKRLPRVLDYLKRLQAKLPKTGASIVHSPLSLAKDEGQWTKDTAKPLDNAAKPLAERAEWRPLHSTPLRRQENSRGSWLSHRTADGLWCKGKPQRAGESA